MKKEISKKYNHKIVESDKYDFWLKHNLFEPDFNSNKQSFSIILPPPNVTGHLHLGHAWDTSYQDMIIRYKKLCGFNVFWVPGTDHAGIATQTKFEKHLKDTNSKNKYELGREKFLELLMEWKDNQANFIRQQWKKLGLALSYKHEKFTMDSDVNHAVNKVFVDFYNNNLIYRAKKLVNWDPVLKTAISNIEVIYKPTKSKMYYFKYYTEDKKKFIIVATTRPETMFGDTCLIANPTDKRYTKYKNTKFINPANNQLIPMIYDEYVDKEFGTGAMKCTPAHDFNDYALGKKHNLEFINIMNPDGTMNSLTNQYAGLDRFECRKQLVSNLLENNLVEKIEEIENNIGYSERSNAIVEPLMSYQWFVSMSRIAEKIINNQNSNSKTNFIPSRFNSTLLTWLQNIEDWCISRQLWWGHQLPIWYNNKNESIYCGLTEPKDKQNWTRDSDVLDTWFSSSLWPMVTLDWPNTDSVKFKKFFPTDVLITGYDIIFFWVSRMLSMSIENLNQIPFKNVLIHGLIRDEKGRKMSKSLGNGIDPMDVVDEYGADSLRLFLTSSSTLGEDLNYSPTKLASNWNFLNKVWNGYRYISSLITDNKIDINQPIDMNKLTVIDKYILMKFNLAIKEITKAYDNYNFVVSTKNIIQFVWDLFFNNYLELTKLDKSGNNIKILSYLLKQSIILLHPQAPFITEEIYSNLFANNDKLSIMQESWPTEIGLKINNNEIKLVEYLLDINIIVRKIRLEQSISNKDNVEIYLSAVNKNDLDAIQKDLNKISHYLSGLKIVLKFEDLKSNNSIQYISEYFKINFIVNINNDDKLAKLLKDEEFIKSELNRVENILNNPNFISKANPDKVKLEQEKHTKYKQQLSVVQKEIESLKNETN